MDEARRITQACSLPLLCDADTGFGEALNVERTVRLFENAGVAGIHLEDQQLPKRCGHLSGKSLVEAEEMAAKIRAAVGRQERSELRHHRPHRFAAASAVSTKRCAGPSSICKPAPTRSFPRPSKTRRSSPRLPQAVPAPLLANNTEFGRSPNLDVAEFGRLGYRMVLFPLTAFRSALRAAQDTLIDRKIWAISASSCRRC